MSRFSTNITNLTVQCTKLQEISSELDHIASSLNETTQMMKDSGNSTGIQCLSKKMLLEVQNMKDFNKKIKAMESGMEQIKNLYVNTEKFICSEKEIRNMLLSGLKTRKDYRSAGNINTGNLKENNQKEDETTNNKMFLWINEARKCIPDVTSLIVPLLMLYDIYDTATKNSHYSRNQYNQIPEDLNEIITKDENGDWIVNENTGWREESKGKNACHQYTSGKQGQDAVYNRKFLYPNEDGSSYEAIICTPPGREPYLVTREVDEKNYGTYNFADPEDIPGSIKHCVRDLLPYLSNGNHAGDWTGMESFIGKIVE